jgi:hypothetical protein
MKLSPPAEVSYLVTGRASRPEILITSSSFETRCLGVISMLSSELSRYSADHAVIVNYTDEGDADVGRRAEELGDALRYRVAAVTHGHEVEEITLEPHAMLPAASRFTELLDAAPVGSTITIDITTLTKPHVMFLAAAAYRHEHVAQMRLLYTRAARYGRGEALSWGAQEPLVLPLFGQPMIPGRSSSLLLFCGLEPNRSYAVWKQYSSAKAGWLAFVSPSGDSDGVLSRAQSWHEFVRRGGWREIVLPAFSPHLTREFVQSVVLECEQRHEHLFICPLTTKWEALAVAMCFGENPDMDASVVYAAPGRYNARAYSGRGWGAVLESSLSPSEL